MVLLLVSAMCFNSIAAETDDFIRQLHLHQLLYSSFQNSKVAEAN